MLAFLESLLYSLMHHSPLALTMWPPRSMNTSLVEFPKSLYPLMHRTPLVLTMWPPLSTSVSLRKLPKSLYPLMHRTPLALTMWPSHLTSASFGEFAQVIVPFDAPHALVVDHVAIALDERVFAQIAQVIVPFDELHALGVDHVASSGLSNIACCGRTLWQHFGLAKLFRGTSEDARFLLSMREIRTNPLQKLWRSVQQDQSLMTALKRRCAADKVALSSAFHVDHTQFLDMQKQVRKEISAENVSDGHTSTTSSSIL